MPDTLSVAANIVVGPGVYPASTIPIAEIEEESLEWRDTMYPFDREYAQVILLNSSSLTMIRLQYQYRSAAEFTTLRSFWRSVGGMVQRFPFTHPITGVLKQMRFAEDGFKWEYYSPADRYHVTVTLEEAPY